MKNYEFLAVAALAVIMAGCDKKEEEGGQAVVQDKTRAVRVCNVVKYHFEDKILVQGTLEAKNYANVAARVDGNLVEIAVDKGDTVEAGKTRLFTSDKDNRERTVDTARQNLAAMRQNHKVALANVERVKVELKKADMDKERYVRLHKNGSATDNEVELYMTQYEQACAGLKYAEASADAVAEQVKGAEIALAIAEKDLADCIIYAPISGVVSKRLKEPGEQGSRGGVVLRIEDLSKIEAVAHIPAQYYSRVIPGETKIRLAIDGKDAGEYAITYRSPVIDTTLRTFEIKALIAGDANRGLVPGAMADITMVMLSREALAVPTHSVLQRNKGTMVYVPRDGVAVPCLVKTGLENEGLTEVSGEGIEEGAQIISEGQYMLSDNDKINIQE